MDYAFGDLPERLPFLKGLSQVCSRLPAKQADLLMSHMQQALDGQDQTPKEDDPEWEDYWDFLALAQDRASKGAIPRSALKGRLSPASLYKRESKLLLNHVLSQDVISAKLPLWLRKRTLSNCLQQNTCTCLLASASVAAML